MPVAPWRPLLWACGSVNHGIPPTSAMSCPDVPVSVMTAWCLQRSRPTLFLTVFLTETDPVLPPPRCCMSTDAVQMASRLRTTRAISRKTPRSHRFVWPVPAQVPAPALSIFEFLCKREQKCQIAILFIISPPALPPSQGLSAARAVSGADLARTSPHGISLDVPESLWKRAHLDASCLAAKRAPGDAVLTRPRVVALDPMHPAPVAGLRHLHPFCPWPAKGLRFGVR